MELRSNKSTITTGQADRSPELASLCTPQRTLGAICGLEGMPGTGKTTLLSKLPAENVSDYAGSDVGPSRYPTLKVDRSGHHALSLQSVWRSTKFFINREEARTRDLEQRGVSWAVLERTWISNIVFNYSISQALRLPKDLIQHSFDQIEEGQQTGKLYFPSWLLIMKIPERESFRRVVLRDGRYFGDNMLETFTDQQREHFLRARAEAYRRLEKTQGLQIVTMSYKAPIKAKEEAVKDPPDQFTSPSPEMFFKTFRAQMLNGD